MNETKQCELCGEDFDPETSKYDDTCDECAYSLYEEI